VPLGVLSTSLNWLEVLHNTDQQRRITDVSMQLIPNYPSQSGGFELSVKIVNVECVCVCVCMCVCFEIEIEIYI
jgi:hypothetical protein